jgi:hypothetical protein
MQELDEGMAFLRTQHDHLIASIKNLERRCEG